MKTYAMLVMVPIIAERTSSPPPSFALLTSLPLLPSAALMSSGMLVTVAVIGGIAAVIAIVAVFALRSARKRSEALQKIATQLGFSFEKNGGSFDQGIIKRPHLLKLGSSGSLYNLMRGPSAAGDMALFDYRYTQGSDEDQQTTFQTVAAFRAPNAGLPEFQLGAERWWHKVGKMFGYQVIQFDSHPKFGKRYLLRGANEEAVRQFFRPSLLEYFLSLPEKPVWSVEAAAPWLLVYIPSKVAKPDQLPEFKDSAATVASNVLAGIAAHRTP